MSLCLDHATCRQIAAQAIASGALVMPNPVKLTPAQMKARHYNEQRRIVTERMRAEAKLDRAVSEVRAMGDSLKPGELPLIARARGVDLERLRKRLNGETRKSRL